MGTSGRREESEVKVDITWSRGESPTGSPVAGCMEKALASPRAAVSQLLGLVRIFSPLGPMAPLAVTRPGELHLPLIPHCPPTPL